MVPPSDQSGSIVHASQVDVVIDHSDILRGISLSIAAGRLVGLVGPNGSGKTTLLRALSGLIPFRGEIQFRGEPIRSWKPKRLAREMAFVRQSVSLSFDFTVSELVLMGRTPHKGWLEDYGRDDRRHALEALRLVDLESFEERSVLSLSGGELQRVFLAQALVQEADVLLLDEPIAHLDVHYQFEFMDLVSDLVRRGRTAVVVFHDLEMAARYADEMIVLSGGRLVRRGPPQDVLTADVIANVFRMDARISRDPNGRLHISYNGPIGKLETVSE